MGPEYHLNRKPDAAPEQLVRRWAICITERRMNAQSIYDMLRKRAEQAGVKDFSPHDFRRTFVGEMLERGVDIATVANKLHFPY